MKKMIQKIKCLFGHHTWFYRQTGMLRSIYCVWCPAEIFPEGEDYFQHKPGCIFTDPIKQAHIVPRDCVVKEEEQ